MKQAKPRGDYKTQGYFLVKDVLARAEGKHLSADDIYEALRVRGERVGRTTVYRQLERLIEEGGVRRTASERGAGCFSYINDGCKEHYHTVCTACGRLGHLSCDQVEQLFHHLGHSHGFMIDPSRTTLYGLCAACVRERKKKENTHA